MKFTSEDLMKAMGLNVGDRIEVFNDILEVQIKDNEAILVPINDTFIESIGVKNVKTISIGFLVGIKYEILPRPKRVGDMLCTTEIPCSNCPIRIICRGNDYFVDDTLYENFSYHCNGNIKDQEIHDLLKARLDKEVE